MHMDWTVLDQLWPPAGGASRAAETVLRDLPFAWHLPNDTLAGFLRPFAISVAGFQCEIALRPLELLESYLPMARFIHESCAAPHHRLLVGLAGVPGSGKSTVLAVLKRLWQALRLAPTLQTLAMDGYHLPNAVLGQRTIEQPDGTIVSLRIRKGCPQSFDLPTILHDLRLLHCRHTVLDLPRYDRNLHEPVAGAVRVGAGEEILVFEGNYLLCAWHPWCEVSRLFDIRMFLDTPRPVARAGLIARHERGGSSPHDAQRRVKENDDLNATYVSDSWADAHLIITADENHHLVRIRREGTAG